MQAAIHTEQSYAVAFDAEVMAVPEKHHFREDYWRSQNAITGTATGRGNSWFIDAPFGQVVLRQYLRGGWAVRVSRDRYFYTGVERSRPFQEFSILVALLNSGLPVPKPVAALCEHSGLFSRGALITRTIEKTHTLADYLPPAPDNKNLSVVSGVSEPSGEDAQIWQKTGRCIRRFHAAGLWHADLNARNILIDADQEVYLIDFDRARFTPEKSVDGRENLSRLKRSLVKICAQNHEEFVSKEWIQLMEGYDD